MPMAIWKVSELIYGSLEHNWQVESRWLGQEYCYLPINDSCLYFIKLDILFVVLGSKMIEGYSYLLLLLSQQTDQKMTLII